MIEKIVLGKMIRLKKKCYKICSYYSWLCLLFGSLGVIIGSLIVRRYWHERQRKIQEDNIRKQLEITRRDRRRRARDSGNNENQLCVVCKENPREVCFFDFAIHHLRVFMHLVFLF